MYRYDAYDHTLVQERVAQFRDQTARFLRGELSEEEFRPLRLQNGLYRQRQAPMLRVAIPYGLLSAGQLRRLASIAERYDRGYGHFTTRQNLQYNWPELERVPDILAELAEVEMHAIQTSGNCIRNITSDPLAGVAADEIVDPRPYCEILRQWSTLHPEFAHLPRKFKVAVNGAREDRAVIAVHDLGIQLDRDAAGEVVAEIWVGGGLGRTPFIGSRIRQNLPAAELLTYIEAILRLYNRYGRRDNMYKARIKILVNALGAEEFARQVEAEWQHLRGGPARIPDSELLRVAACFTAPAYASFSASELATQAATLAAERQENRAFDRFCQRNLLPHRQPGYSAVGVTLKRSGSAPGDASAAEMHRLADLADTYSAGELRLTHEQNVVLSDVRLDQLFALWRELKVAGLATPNLGLISDLISCPGGDFCSLANARSLPVAAAIQQAVDDLDYQFDLGELSLNISGCINACGHHHIGNIGILGVDKNGEEFFQITLGGRQGKQAALGKVIGRAFAAEEIPAAIRRLLDVYVEQRQPDEPFIDTLERIGSDPFKQRVYAGTEAH